MQRLGLLGGGAPTVPDIVRTAADSPGLADVQVFPRVPGAMRRRPGGGDQFDLYYTERQRPAADRPPTARHQGTGATTSALCPESAPFTCNPSKGTPAYDGPAAVAPPGQRQGGADELKQSGLRGMGGAGFPTGTKWEFVRNTLGEVKYVVCNADESEPGTSKDRLILQNMPDLLFEGMAMAALIVGARKAIVYIRHEYPRERETLHGTLRQWHSRAASRVNAVADL